MSFAYHRDSYLRSLTVDVKSCLPSSDRCYIDITTSDSVLFPGGGGQPMDLGTLHLGDHGVVVCTPIAPCVHRVLINDIAINNNTNDVTDVVGSSTIVAVDFDRRFDHMQQHSAQHVLSAMADELGHTTLSWHLGEHISYVEFASGNHGEAFDDIEGFERKANLLIRESRPVTVELLDETKEEYQGRSRGLPEGVSGPIRIVEIEGLDRNMCCGTHVRNLGDLQCIKLLYMEPAKVNEKSVKVFFVAGTRVLNELGRLYDYERSMVRQLCCSAGNHAALTAKMSKSLKAEEKAHKNLLKELGDIHGRHCVASTNNNGILFYHRPDGDAEYLAAFSKHIDKAIDAVLITGDINKPADGGCIFVQGPRAGDLGNKIMSAIDGKGFLVKGAFKGKFPKFTAAQKKSLNAIIESQ